MRNLAWILCWRILYQNIGNFFNVFSSDEGRKVKKTNYQVQPSIDIPICIKWPRLLTSPEIDRTQKIRHTKRLCWIYPKHSGNLPHNTLFMCVPNNCRVCSFLNICSDVLLSQLLLSLYLLRSTVGAHKPHTRPAYPNSWQLNKANVGYAPSVEATYPFARPGPVV